MLTGIRPMAVRMFCLGILLFSVGCTKVELYSQLDERQANEMMAILLTDDIRCDKKSGDEGTWVLTVSQSDFSRAVNQLREQGYPKEQYVGIGDVFKKSGLVSSPTEERIRFMHALSQELSQTITQIDGVLSARVHIVLPNNNPFGDTIQPSSASVFVKHRPGVDLTVQVPEITRLVVGSIEGLEYDAVSTVLFAADEAQVVVANEGEQRLSSMGLFDIQVPSESRQTLWIILGGLAALVLALLGWSMYLLFGKRRTKAVDNQPVKTGPRSATRPLTA